MDSKKANGSETKKVNGSANGQPGAKEWRVKVGLAEMLKGGVIMDVTNAEQARIAEKAGAWRGDGAGARPSDIRKEGGVARMASIKVIREIMATVTIPVMARCASAILPKRKFCRRWKSISSTRAKYSRRPMKKIISGSMITACLLCAARAISAKRCGALPRARR